MGGTIVPAFTRPGSLRRSSSAYSSPSQLFAKNSITRQLQGQSAGTLLFAQFAARQRQKQGRQDSGVLAATQLHINRHRSYALEITKTVIPPEAGILRRDSERIWNIFEDRGHWIPASSGMTRVMTSNCVSPFHRERGNLPRTTTALTGKRLPRRRASRDDQLDTPELGIIRIRTFP